jgi:putative transposase
MESNQMQRKRYTEEQIVRILGEAEGGVTVEELTRKYGVSRNTIYRWRSKYGGLEVSDVRRMKELEEENRRLKKIVADLTLEIDAVKRVLKKKW